MNDNETYEHPSYEADKKARKIKPFNGFLFLMAFFLGPTAVWYVAHFVMMLGS